MSTNPMPPNATSTTDEPNPIVMARVLNAKRGHAGRATDARYAARVRRSRNTVSGYPILVLYKVVKREPEGQTVDSGFVDD